MQDIYGPCLEPWLGRYDTGSRIREKNPLLNVLPWNWYHVLGKGEVGLGVVAHAHNSSWKARKGFLQLQGSLDNKVRSRTSWAPDRDTASKPHNGNKKQKYCATHWQSSPLTLATDTKNWCWVEFPRHVAPRKIKYKGPNRILLQPWRADGKQEGRFAWWTWRPPCEWARCFFYAQPRAQRIGVKLFTAKMTSCPFTPCPWPREII